MGIKNILRKIGFERGARGVRRAQDGYTLVELMAVLAIIVIISSVTVIGKSYQQNLTLTNLAYDIALSLREAQLYGINTRQAEISSSGVGSFDAGYGVEFKRDSSSFLLYADKNNSRSYESGTDVLLSVYNIKNGNMITEICTVPNENTNACISVPLAPPDSKPYLDVTFTRPEPDACVNVSKKNVRNPKKASVCTSESGYSEARITISSPSNRTKCIRVYSTGQVSVENQCS